MFIRYSNKYIEIKEPFKAINLEVKFNLTINGKIWRKIGDALYYFRDIDVDYGQFFFIIDLAREHLSSQDFNIIL